MTDQQLILRHLKCLFVRLGRFSFVYVDFHLFGLSVALAQAFALAQPQPGQPQPWQFQSCWQTLVGEVALGQQVAPPSVNEK